ncbi:MAG: AAA family ATPase [Verrucomicrobiota bacterium]
MKILSSYSIKGGVGKTALAVNLAFAFSDKGYRALLIDLDPQGAAAFYFRVDSAEKFKMTDKRSLIEGLRRNIRESDFPGLDIIPSNLAYRHFDILLHGMKKRRTQLRNILDGLKSDYDVIVLDCPPNITLLSENIFRATDAIVVPVIPTVLSQRTFEQLLEFFEEKEISPDILRPFFSMAQSRNKMHRAIMNSLSSAYPNFLHSVIPFSAEVEKMGIQRMPLLAYAGNSSAGKAYQALCEEILDQWEFLK